MSKRERIKHHGRGRLPVSFLLFRVGAIVAFALISALSPGLGPYHLWFSAYVLFVVVPISILLETKFPIDRYGWVQPLFDCLACVIGVQFIPGAWMSAYMVGLLSANSRLLIPSGRNFLFIVTAHALLVVGMTIAAIVHQVDGWGLPTMTVLASLPAVLFYAHREGARMMETRRRHDRMQTLSLVSGGVAHDFNNLLTGISANAQLAKRMLLRDGDEAATLESIEAVVDACECATELTQQLTCLAGGKGSGEARIDAESEIRSFLRILKNMIPHDIEIQLVVSEKLPLVRVGRVELQQVVMNLVLNAVEAVEAEGTVRIEVTRAGDDRIEIEVADDGRGIPRDDLSRIFEPFFSSKSYGTGIGLSNVQRIIEASGGRITAESRVGVGTRMKVSLPTREMEIG